MIFDVSFTVLRLQCKIEIVSSFRIYFPLFFPPWYRKRWRKTIRCRIKVRNSSIEAFIFLNSFHRFDEEPRQTDQRLCLFVCAHKNKLFSKTMNYQNLQFIFGPLRYEDEVDNKDIKSLTTSYKMANFMTMDTLWERRLGFFFFNQASSKSPCGVSLFYQRSSLVYRSPSALSGARKEWEGWRGEDDAPEGGRRRGVVDKPSKQLHPPPPPPPPPPPQTPRPLAPSGSSSPLPFFNFLSLSLALSFWSFNFSPESIPPSPVCLHLDTSLSLSYNNISAIHHATASFDQ